MNLFINFYGVPLFYFFSVFIGSFLAMSISSDGNVKLGLWSHYNRILKDNCPIVLFAAQPFTTALIESNKKDFKYDWIWTKTKGTGHLNAKKQTLRDKEDVLVFYESSVSTTVYFKLYKPDHVSNQCLKYLFQASLSSRVAAGYIKLMA